MRRARISRRRQKAQRNRRDLWRGGRAAVQAMAAMVVMALVLELVLVLRLLLLPPLL